MSEKEIEYNINKPFSTKQLVQIKNTIIPLHLVRFITLDKGKAIKFWLEPANSHANETLLSVEFLSSQNYFKVLEYLQEKLEIKKILE